MATPSVEEVLTDQATDGSASVATAAGTDVGDLLLALGVSDFYDLASFGPPTPGTWTLLESAGPDDDAHLRVWARLVDSSGANTVSLASIQDEDVGLYCYRLRGVDQSAPVDASGSDSSGTLATAHVAPSISPASDDALLVCVWATGNGAYTDFPEGMTVREPIDGDPFYECQAADQALSADGATGTRTATFNASRAWVAASIAVQGPAGAGGITGSGVSVAPAGAAAGSGSAAVAGTGAAVAAPVVAAAVGQLVVAGAGVTMAPAATAVAGGTVAVAGVGASIAPAGVASGACAVLISGAGASVAPAGIASGSSAPPPETPAERTLVIPAESRQLVVAAEPRTLTIAAEDRRLRVQ